MPKGQSPSTKLKARRNRLGEEINRLSGEDLPWPTMEKDDPLIPRGSASMVRRMTNLRRSQLESMNKDALAKKRRDLEKIDSNQEARATRVERQGYRSGGMVRAKPFRGTF